MKKKVIAKYSEIKDRQPYYALVANVDLVIVRYDKNISVLYGRCHHRGALLADGHIKGDNLICGVHNWDYRYDTGVSEYDNSETLHKFTGGVDGDSVWVDEEEIFQWQEKNPQPYNREEYLGNYQDFHGTPEEPFNSQIQALAKNGLKKLGHHGAMSAMGVPLTELPSWKDIQFITAQLSKAPQLDDVPVGSEVVIGPKAKKPLVLKIPLFISDMSFGALSEEAKVALALGAEQSGTGICSGEGGMLPEEQAANSRYFYELASGRFGFNMDKVKQCQAFHFKGGQGAKTGTGGHLPGNKVVGKIAEVRGLQVGEDAISPARFPDWTKTKEIKAFADQVKQATGGIPIGYKLSAQHIEKDIDAALEVGVDYIILDGRGGGTGAAPTLFRDNISVPTIPALGRARRHLDSLKCKDVSLVITGGLRVAEDFTKALAMGADAIALSNSALQAIGCLGMRACHSNNCPVGIATQKVHLRERLIVQASAKRLQNYLDSSVHLMKILARACGHTHLNQFALEDLVTWKKSMHELSGVPFAGVKP
ncbi:MAG: Rieske 2Fe-2S domain-containing protein [Bdellovibrionaceae bacterium]|nr:Rieske 2Fe-2S domain-containing protein [Pseudobdellovibrionaceae bacterium]